MAQESKSKDKAPTYKYWAVVVETRGNRELSHFFIGSEAHAKTKEQIMARDKLQGRLYPISKQQRDAYEITLRMALDMKLNVYLAESWNHAPIDADKD